MQTTSKLGKILVLIVCAVAVIAINADFFQEQAPKQQVMQKEQLTLTLAGGQQLLFNVEVAETHIQRENGLMNRASLPEMEGMLFDFKETLPVQMWMKDTSIPLDMIFLDQNGAVVKIHENAEPNSLAIIQSEIPVYAVLEVIAGTAAKLGIAPGAVATHRIFTPIPEAATPADAAPSAPAPQ